MSNLKNILNNKIEEWIYKQPWDSEGEVSTAISSTNAIFDEIYCENITIKNTNQTNKYHFKSKITMYGEPRKDDVPFCGDIIDIHIKGIVIVNNENLDNLTISSEQVSADVREWSEPISFDEIISSVDDLQKIPEKKFTTKDIGKLFNVLCNFPSHFWFRGQLNESWELKPSIARIKKPSLALEKVLRAEFQNQSAFLDSIGPLSDNIEKTTFLMQHHKVPTRLLDWTTSPLIALYFSVCQIDHTDHGMDKNSCIWVLDPKALNKAYKKSFPLLLGKKGVKKLYESKDLQEKCLAIHAPYTNLRMRMQKSEFTIHTTYKPMESYNTGFLKEKIIISKDIKDSILKQLHRLGVDQCFLFPDLDNIGLGITKRILK